MGVDDTLGSAGGARRVAHRRGTVLVLDVELDREGRIQQGFVPVDLGTTVELGELASWAPPLPVRYLELGPDTSF